MTPNTSRISTTESITTTWVSVSNAVPNIEKLEIQQNYGSWKLSMEMYLVLDGLFGYVDGTICGSKLTDIVSDHSAITKIYL